tara:strand:- start:844 stop:1197 length:354 start_codon:yes stop_codon:yes gene_type:complete
MMQRFRSSSFGVDQGEVILFSDFEHDGEMWTGSGPREYSKFVAFRQSFLSPPLVHLGISMWDISNRANARADIQTGSIKPEGFTVIFRTWGDSKVARIRVSWLAMGDLFEEDDWRIE